MNRNEMPCGNTAALRQYERDQDRAEARTRRLILDNPVCAYESDAEAAFWNEEGAEFMVGTDGLLATPERTDAIKRLLLDAVGMSHMLPVGYRDTLRIRDEALLKGFTEEWLYEYARMLRDQAIDRAW